MSDTEAEAAFAKVRWPQTNGAPVCPLCGGLCERKRGNECGPRRRGNARGNPACPYGIVHGMFLTVNWAVRYKALPRTIHNLIVLIQAVGDHWFFWIPSSYALVSATQKSLGAANR
jgi:hypothetical protein